MLSVAHAVLLSVWHEVQGFGILYLSVIAGVMNAKVCPCTFTSAMVVSIFGIWQATHWLAALPAAWCRLAGKISCCAKTDG